MFLNATPRNDDIDRDSVILIGLLIETSHRTKICGNQRNILAGDPQRSAGDTIRLAPSTRDMV